MIARPAFSLPFAVVARPVDSGYARGGVFYGANEIANGGFDSDTVWSHPADWTIAAGIATIAVAAGTRNLTQSGLALVEGAPYEVTFTVLNYVSGSVTASIIGGTIVSGTARSSNGTFTQILVAGPTPSTFRIQAAISSSLSVDNVRLRRVL